MAESLKRFFDARIVGAIAGELSGAHPRFRRAAFTRACLEGLDGLELTDRARHIAAAMREHLPRPFPAAAKVIVRSLGPELQRSDSFGMEPFRYLPHVFFVAAHGLDSFEASMRAQYELTKRFSAEFSIRAFLERHPAATWRRLHEWAGDANVHVRRLVSEGTRPRLPWAPRLRGLQRDPTPVLELLERLRDDPERYVQRSVANNLNDIAKDHPDRVIALCRRWSAGAPPDRRWVVRHGLRSLVKSGHRGALSLLGAGDRPRVRLARVRLPRRLRLGESLRFSFELASTSPRSQTLLVDFAVHFVKADGGTRRKVFKLRRAVCQPGESIGLEGRVSFAELTTRRHYPGDHRLEAVVNGVGYPLGSVRLVAAG